MLPSVHHRFSIISCMLSLSGVLSKFFVMSDPVIVSVSALDGSLRTLLLPVCPQCAVPGSLEDSLSPGTSQIFKTKGEPSNDNSLPRASPWDQGVPRKFIPNPHLWLDAEDAAWLWKTHTDGTGHGSYTMDVLSNAPKLRHINEPTLHEDQHSAGFHVLLPFLLPGKRGWRKSAARLTQSHSPVCCCQPGYSS